VGGTYTDGKKRTCRKPYRAQERNPLLDRERNDRGGQAESRGGKRSHFFLLSPDGSCSEYQRDAATLRGGDHYSVLRVRTGLMSAPVRRAARSRSTVIEREKKWWGEWGELRPGKGPTPGKLNPGFNFLSVAARTGGQKFTRNERGLSYGRLK